MDITWRNEKEARAEILGAVTEYYERYMSGPAHDIRKVPYAGRVFDQDELMALTESALDFWLTAGRFSDQFESRFAEYLGVRHAHLINSGSSANLVAFMALTAPELGNRRIMPGDEVITVAAGFPTTVAPIIQYGAVPVFVDVTIPQYNIDATMLDEALSERTKAVMVAHTLGNPFNLKAVKAFCDKHGLWLVEDNCDALGSTYELDGRTRLTGTVGHIGTSSFYPAHHITMGEGGCVYTDDDLLSRLMLSYRDWGRACSCPPGKDGTCGHRFDGQFGTLPEGYDHKYVYSHLGYNLKATDMQAAVGCAQLNKLDRFIEARRRNWTTLRSLLDHAQSKIILPEPEPNSNPSWFGFLMTCRDGVDRGETVRRIEALGVQTRMLFGGNLTRHPCFDGMRTSGKGYRVVGDLRNTDAIAERSFWVGVYPGITDIDADRIAKSVLSALDM